MAQALTASSLLAPGNVLRPFCSHRGAPCVCAEGRRSSLIFASRRRKCSTDEFILAPEVPNTTGAAYLNSASPRPSGTMGLRAYPYKAVALS
ncbi:hypothetical protein AAFF_G00243910 [Aldrovandia affinis]|uniref:Uncharacterized protein n=1 Tax=Aldrovandia affinis TaxID=143900 RepID=A0AAD7RDV5_9TELE|nr:hypothetical protein AAFF_G00243910 [Aldrovandia affinis]